VFGAQNVPQTGPCLITINHYHRPRFPSWWMVLAVNSVVPADIHWVMTAALTFPGHPLRRVLYPTSHWALRKLANLYGFTTMPPMPPRPEEAADRAQAVRQVLDYMRKNPGTIIGLAPEGRDTFGGRLSVPPLGAGRFIALLTRKGMPIVPVAVFEEGDALTVSFGEHYPLCLPDSLRPSQRDALVMDTVLRAIARLLPEHLRGAYSEEKNEPR
jgi:1-acyl-sn-glycerol-3-phosphate acyltransferase